MPDPQTTVTIGLGSNLGDREGYIRRALDSLADHPSIEVLRCSALIETEPWGVLNQPAFLNAVAELRTTLEPRALLCVLKKIERDLGREERDLKWGPREIDLDILFFGDMIVDEPDLKIPHERILERPFVIEQILALDEDAVHPGLNVPLRQFRKTRSTP